MNHGRRSAASTFFNSLLGSEDRMTTVGSVWIYVDTKMGGAITNIATIITAAFGNHLLAAGEEPPTMQ